MGSCVGLKILAFRWARCCFTDEASTVGADVFELTTRERLRPVLRLVELGSQRGRKDFCGGDTNLLILPGYWCLLVLEFFRRCMKFYTATTRVGNYKTD